MFEWDPQKAKTNADKHGVPFEEASLSSSTLTHWTVPICSTRCGSRVFGIWGGLPTDASVMVVYAERGTSDAETIRLINARRASRQEGAAYVEAED